LDRKSLLQLLGGYPSPFNKQFADFFLFLHSLYPVRVSRFARYLDIRIAGTFPRHTPKSGHPRRIAYQ
jgi:hypothetical protein